MSKVQVLLQGQRKVSGIQLNSANIQHPSQTAFSGWKVLGCKSQAEVGHLLLFENLMSAAKRGLSQVLAALVWEDGRNGYFPWNHQEAGMRAHGDLLHNFIQSVQGDLNMVTKDPKNLHMYLGIPKHWGFLTSMYLFWYWIQGKCVWRQKKPNIPFCNTTSMEGMDRSSLTWQGLNRKTYKEKHSWCWR